MHSNIPFVLLDDIEDQLTNIFTANEIINLTKTYAEGIGKEVPIKIVHFNSKKDIISANLGIFSNEEKINFLFQIKEHSKVKNDSELCQEINKAVSSGSQQVIRSRNSITDILSKYPSKIMEQWQRSYYFYDRSDYRNALDNIRLTIELLVKNITGSDASLENQHKNLGIFLESEGISKEIRNLFLKMLNMYEKIQNNEAKHSVPDGLDQKEITLLMNQSAVIIKFLTDCNEKEFPW